MASSEPISDDADAILHADIEGIIETLAEALGAKPIVLHEIVSERFHLDVLSYAPSPARPTRLLVTCGMSALPMTAPPGKRFIELPADWPMDQESLMDPRCYWPIRLLKMLARLPHYQNTFLAIGHTTSDCDPPKPYADDTRLCAAILVPPVNLPEAAWSLPLAAEAGGDAGETASLLQIYPIYAAELDYARKHRAHALFDRLNPIVVHAGLVVALDRPDVCA